ncbi:hypothetical protein cypCar_00041237, partial [Cyprinus carpio]
AVLESKWPSTNQGSGSSLGELRNVVLAVAHFRRANQTAAEERLIQQPRRRRAV